MADQTTVARILDGTGLADIRKAVAGAPEPYRSHYAFLIQQIDALTAALTECRAIAAEHREARRQLAALLEQVRAERGPHPDDDYPDAGAMTVEGTA